MNWLKRLTIKTAQADILYQVANGTYDVNQAIQQLQSFATSDPQSFCSAISQLYAQSTPQGTASLNILESQFCVDQEAKSIPEPQPLESEAV